jgi:hypothetical protein
MYCFAERGVSATTKDRCEFYCFYYTWFLQRMDGGRPSPKIPVLEKICGSVTASLIVNSVQPQVALMKIVGFFGLVKTNLVKPSPPISPLKSLTFVILVSLIIIVGTIKHKALFLGYSLTDRQSRQDYVNVL